MRERADWFGGKTLMPRREGWNCGRFLWRQCNVVMASRQIKLIKTRWPPERRNRVSIGTGYGLSGGEEGRGNGLCFKSSLHNFIEFSWFLFCS